MAVAKLYSGIVGELISKGDAKVAAGNSAYFKQVDFFG